MNISADKNAVRSARQCIQCNFSTPKTRRFDRADGGLDRAEFIFFICIGH